MYSMVLVPLYDTLGPEACTHIINQGNKQRRGAPGRDKGLTWSTENNEKIRLPFTVTPMNIHFITLLIVDHEKCFLKCNVCLCLMMKINLPKQITEFVFIRMNNWHRICWRHNLKTDYVSFNDRDAHVNHLMQDNVHFDIFFSYKILFS